MSAQRPNKIGFRTAGYREWPLADALRSIAEAGYDGVELCLEYHGCRPQTLTEPEAGRVREKVLDAGLQVASVSYHGDDEPDDQRTVNQQRVVRLARTLGADVLILNARKAIAGQEAAQWDDFSGRLKGILEVAEGEGVWIALEPEPGHFLHSSEDMVRLLDQMQHPRLAVNLDVGHAFLTDEDVCASIRRLGASIVHTHLEGMPAGEHRHLEPGAGDLDLAAVVQALDEIRYQGYFTVDLFNIAHDPEGICRRSIEALEAILTR